MKPAISSFLVAGKHVPDQAAWIPLKGGRSNSLWRLRFEDIDWVCKLFHAPDDNPLFPNDSSAEAIVLATLAGSDLAPELIKTVSTPAGLCILYQFLKGKPAHAMPERVAQMLGRLHQSSHRPAVRELPSGSAALSTHAMRILARCHGSDDLIAQRPEIDSLAPVAPVLIHGDATAANIIATETGAVLIDWQCPALADPTEDIAVYLSPAMQVLSTGAVLTGAQQEAFLRTYPDPQTVTRYKRLAPLYHWRMAAYCRWKSEAGHPEYAQAEACELAALQS